MYFCPTDPKSIKPNIYSAYCVKQMYIILTYPSLLVGKTSINQTMKECVLMMLNLYADITEIKCRFSFPYFQKDR